MAIYQYSFTVPKDAVDANNHVNNVTYVAWMQEAAIRHATDTGCMEATLAAGATWIVRSHEIEYLLPIMAGEEVRVLTWVSNFRKVRSLRKYRFLRECDRVLLARGATDWVFMDTKRRRPRSIPEEIRRLFVLVAETQEP